MNNLSSGDDWIRVDRALRELLDLDPAERAARIERTFADRPDLATCLGELLAHASGPGLLDRIMPLAGDVSVFDVAGAQGTLGHWHLIERVGIGGMSEVWRAERNVDGVVQHGAVKLMTLGLASPELRDRFVRERRILARLSDARIARYYDGGIASEARPWLAMEYVEGVPIDVHCDNRRLDLEARMALLADVAGAVDHAHRALIVHRDIKPSNVLVNADGQVKLLDFGIAKQIADYDADGDVTRAIGRVLTPHYASPEQLRSEPATTATDVFLLGLLLFEVIAGERPFASYEADLPGLERALCEIDPPRPSDVLSRRRSAGKAPPIAPREVRGDLDAIVLHALEKLPANRYGSAEALREDLLRWRDGLPVRARRIGALRRGGKWLGRHRWLATAAAAVLLAGVAYAVASRLQSRAIEREASINRAVRDYLIDWFQAAQTGTAAGHDPTASEMLADGLAKARTELSAEPGLQAEILSIVGEIYMARGEYARAEPVLRNANDLYAAAPDLDARHRGANSTRLATLLHYTGRYAEAEPMFRRALKQQIATVGENAVQTLVTRQHLADLLYSRGRYADAIAQYEHTLAAARTTLGEEAALTAGVETGLADVYRDIGRQTEAEALFRRALATQERAYGEMSPATAATHLSLGRLLLDQGRNDEAAAQIEPAFHTFQRIKGRTTPATVYWERFVAELEEARGQLDSAAERLARLAKEMRGQLASGHLMFGYFALDAGYVALARGRIGQAHQQFETARRVFDGIRPQGHPRRIEVLLGESLVAQRRGDIAAARRMLAAARMQARQQLAASHPLFEALAAADATRTSAQKSVGLELLRVQRALAVQETAR
ncbi:MAG: serine/threonine-protein kinase [Rhodanobacteraceae bacterium]